jgi:hypothetical protein
MTSTTTAPSYPPPSGLDFTGAKIANHCPGARVRTWTGEFGEILNLGGERRGMCSLEHRVYRVRLDGETVVHEWNAWMLTSEGK